MVDHENCADKRHPSAETDATFGTGITLPQNQKAPYAGDTSVLQTFESILGASNISADPLKNKHYRTGWRSGKGAALAVLFPQSILCLWELIKVAVEHNLIIIMQAANTGLTEGSTPSGEDYDRPVVIINTLALDELTLLNQGEQILAYPGTTLHKLEQVLAPIKRSPHSVIGSSCLGASIVGGIANNSGGALIKRGPAYTELSVFAKINDVGELELVNHSGIFLGSSADEVIKNLQLQNFATDNINKGSRFASDEEYIERVKQVDANTPSRFNADTRRLFEASGCAGKVAIFAVRLDTHPVAAQEKSFYIGTNNPDDLHKLRRRLLTELDGVPDVGEYMHRDIFEISQKYGKDTFLSVLHLGTKRLPTFFALKGRVDAINQKYSWLPRFFSDKLLQVFSGLFGQHLPNRLLNFRDRFEHHIVLKLTDKSIDKGAQIIKEVIEQSNEADHFECTDDEATRAYLNRFAAAGAAMRYQVMHEKDVGDFLALDIALKRNEHDWFETLPEHIAQYVEKSLYYGHFFCHVFHQDYILKKGADVNKVKALMLEELNKREAKYPAEHNVGHLYEAEPTLTEFYNTLDPHNVFNPGIGKQSKYRRNCGCGFAPAPKN